MSRRRAAKIYWHRARNCWVVRFTNRSEYFDRLLIDGARLRSELSHGDPKAYLAGAVTVERVRLGPSDSVGIVR
jgi:hypothetical protein